MFSESCLKEFRKFAEREVDLWLVPPDSAFLQKFSIPKSSIYELHFINDVTIVIWIISARSRTVTTAHDQPTPTYARVIGATRRKV